MEIPTIQPGDGGPTTFRLAETTFAALDAFTEDDFPAAFAAFRASAGAIADRKPPLRAAVPPDAALRSLCHAVSRAGPATSDAARLFFERRFTPFRVVPENTPESAPGGFLTGYYEPVVAGALQCGPDFTAPVLARPETLARLGPGDPPAPGLSRREVEAGAARGAFRAVAWLRDWVEVFFVHVQGSARVRLEDGRTIRLVYDGRNGHPYISIGRHLVETGRLTPEGAALERLKAWIRAHGQAIGEEGRDVLQTNASYIFFRAEDAPANEGPIGGAGVPLAPLRSIAVDRSVWPYGLPFWIEADIPWAGAVPSRFRRLMIAQDTGSAIKGPARADVFFGSGEDAGARAGLIRHPGAMVVLLPRTMG